MPEVAGNTVYTVPFFMFSVCGGRNIVSVLVLSDQYPPRPPCRSPAVHMPESSQFVVPTQRVIIPCSATTASPPQLIRTVVSHLYGG
ncbi:hypothetical protein BaRGS_00005953 [Batillaria attramentaria]|uniref:Uncharacterized protein n=1 Tax=Batillaria attramentaria TaxID=370345 RepID=A0ABD0LTJ2_9CAEN